MWAGKTFLFLINDIPGQSNSDIHYYCYWSIRLDSFNYRPELPWVRSLFQLCFPFQAFIFKWRAHNNHSVHPLLPVTSNTLDLQNAANEILHSIISCFMMTVLAVALGKLVKFVYIPSLIGSLDTIRWLYLSGGGCVKIRSETTLSIHRMHAGRNSNEKCARVRRIVLHKWVLAIHSPEARFGGDHHTMGNFDKHSVHQKELRKGLRTMITKTHTPHHIPDFPTDSWNRISACRSNSNFFNGLLYFQLSTITQHNLWICGCHRIPGRWNAHYAAMQSAGNRYHKGDRTRFNFHFGLPHCLFIFRTFPTWFQLRAVLTMLCRSWYFHWLPRSLLRMVGNIMRSVHLRMFVFCSDAWFPTLVKSIGAIVLAAIIGCVIGWLLRWFPKNDNRHTHFARFLIIASSTYAVITSSVPFHWRDWKCWGEREIHELEQK